MKPAFPLMLVGPFAIVVGYASVRPSGSRAASSGGSSSASGNGACASSPGIGASLSTDWRGVYADGPSWTVPEDSDRAVSHVKPEPEARTI